MDPTTHALVPAMANMQLVAAHAQNQALQANNEANTQMLQIMEKIQKAFQAITEENARLSAEMQSLKAQIKTERDLHQEEIKALKDQITAVQKQSADTAQKEVKHEQQIVHLEEQNGKILSFCNEHKHLIEPEIACPPGGYRPRDYIPPKYTYSTENKIT